VKTFAIKIANKVKLVYVLLVIGITNFF